ncbi:MAG: ribonuclease J [Clostridia bacterium]|nr:ribonuclease J [Clostridia bacterium]
MAKGKEKLKIIPLGGLQEIGKNLTIFEYGNEIVIVDCGVAFPEDDMLGVDLVIPDITYLEKNASKIKGIVITHGHEDHIGSIPYFLKKINVPIYATKLTMGLIETKLEEHGLMRTSELYIVKATDVIKLGQFNVELIKTTHSIADAVALALHTPVGTIVHTGDFKVDYTPIDGEVMDIARFAELGKEGVLMLMSDSTNVERPGYTMSERSVGLEFDKIFMSSNKRIIVATFASNIHRMQQIINSAVKMGRKIAAIGRSVLRVIDVAKELGYISAPEGAIIDIDKIGLYNPEQIVIITTGSQGETMSALSRMAAGEHRKVKITADDLVIFSSSPIPGNEKSVGRVIDDLQKLGAEVIYNQLADVHVSGHACQEELKLMLTLIKPKFFMPVHGEYRFLKRHGEIAQLLGMSDKDIFIMSNGRVLEIDAKSAKMGQQVQSGIILVDGLGVGDVGNIVIRDRQLLSENGMILVVFSLNGKTAKLVGGPDIITRGFVYVRESEDLMEEIKEFSKKQILKLEEEGVREWSVIKSKVRDSLCDFVYKKTRRNPMILPIITEVNVKI